MKSVFHVGSGIGESVELLCVRLVFRKYQLIRSLGAEVIGAGGGVCGFHHGHTCGPLDLPQLGFARHVTHWTCLVAPAPGVSKPECWQHLALGWFRPTVYHSDLDQNVFLGRLGVLDENVKITVIFKYPGVQKFVFKIVESAPPVFSEQVCVRKLGLGILVKHLHVAVRGGAVEIEIVLFDIFPVVALGVGQTKQPLLEEGIPAVPEGQGQAEILVPVADSGQAILIPAVDSAAGMLVGEEIPGFSVFTVIFAHRSPGALAEVRSPLFPIRPALAIFFEPSMFGGIVGSAHTPSPYYSGFRCQVSGVRKKKNSR